MFLDHHNTQRGEAQLTYKNGGVKQLASLSPPTSVKELQRNAQLRAFSCPRYGYTSVCPPPTPSPSTNVWKE